MKFFKFSPIILLLLLTFGEAFSQDLNFDWVKQLARIPAPWYENDCIGVDSSKNVYVAGNFEYTKDFDPGAAVFNLTTIANQPGMYISKLDPSGSFVWAKSLGGKKDNYLKDLFVDASGNLYCCGNFKDTTDFDPGLGIFNLISDDLLEYNGFLAKYNSAGDFQWAKKLNSNAAESVALDSSGNIYIVGSFWANQDIDPGPAVLTESTWGNHISIRKFDNNGNFSWGKILTSNNHSYGKRIKLDKSNNIYIEGQLIGTVDFDPGSNIYNLSSIDIFTYSKYICKLDSSGNFRWAHTLVGGSIAPDDQENLICFDYGGRILKYDINGNLLWTKQSGGVPYTEADINNRHLAIDKYGGIYFCGVLRDTHDFDPGSGVFNLTVTPGDIFDIFISKLDMDGNFVWAKQIGGSSRDMANGLAMDKSGSLYLTGFYQYTVDFDPGPGIHTMTYSPWATFFLKLSPCQQHSDSTIVKNVCNSFTLNNVNYDSSGTYTQILRNTVGCDSFITLKLLVNKSTSYQTVTTCKEFYWNSHYYNTSGMYTDTLVSSIGCDSIVHLDLLIKSTSFSSLNVTICEGQNYFSHTSDGIYIDTFIAANGCDSIRTLSLSVNHHSYNSIRAAICDGYNYLGHTMTGIYTDTIPSANGCDSIRTLDLIVFPKKITDVYQSICKGQIYAGHSFAGVYYDTLSTLNGCDSIVIIHLVINNLPQPNLGVDRNICENEKISLTPGIYSTYRWQDNSTNNSFEAMSTGTYSVYVTDVNNCTESDTIRIVKIDTIPTKFLPADQSICTGEDIRISLHGYKEYKWSTGEQSQYIDIKNPGKYFVTVSDFNNCIGIDTIEIFKNDNCIPISVPNAFSPNQNGLNDFFKPTITQEVSGYLMEIYNRYGEIIFVSTDQYTGWDGNYKGIKQNADTYVYRIRFKNNSGIVTYKKGSCILLR